MKVLFRLSNIQ